MNENKIYITAPEMAEMLDISLGHAYKIIRGLNNELKNDGYIVIAGKIPRDYFKKRWFGYSATLQPVEEPPVEQVDLT